MRALSRALALILLVSGLASAQGVPGALLPCKMDGSDCAPATGTVTTTGTLASGQVALGSGATSITGDAGLTGVGTGTGFKLGIGTDVFISRASAGVLLVEDGSGNARDVQARTGTFGTSVVTPLVSGGADSATPNATVVTGTGSRGGTDTNVAGGNLTIRPGAGTGSATGSSIVFQTPTAGASGTTAQTQTTRLTVDESGATFTVPIYGTLATIVSGGRFGGSAGADVGYTNAGVTLAATSPYGWTAGATPYGAFDTQLSHPSAGVVSVDTATIGNALGTIKAATVVSTGTVRLAGYTVATLPAGTVGDTAYVTDATAPTYLGALTGGGAVVCPVIYNGAAWVSH